MTIGPDGAITDVNEATERVTGYTRQELIGTSFLDYFTQPEEARAGYETAFRDGLVRDYPLELRHRDGGAMSVLYNASVYRGADGDVIGVFAAARDVTARRKAEQELELRRAQLEDTVGALRHSVADKEVLLKEIHHRVKNNLQIVSSLLHMQTRLTTDPAAQELLRESENRVQSMGAIHESLYSSSDLTRVDLPKYLRHVLERVSDSYRKSHVNCVLESQGTTSATIEIAMPCGLIVNELLSNALKHGFNGETTAANPGRVVVRVSEADGRISISVANSGRALPAGFRVEGGTGLGLQLVRALVGQLNGGLRVVREGGTRFELEFPAGVEG